MMPLPVMASVTMARANPIMAARPLSCSEKAVNPCGTFSSLGRSSDIMTAARRAGAAVTALREKLVEEMVVGRERASGVAATNAIFGWLVGWLGELGKCV